MPDLRRTPDIRGETVFSRFVAAEAHVQGEGPRVDLLSPADSLEGGFGELWVTWMWSSIDGHEGDMLRLRAISLF